ncbi:uncharacterized protein KY384_006612 [Bacidia gigantensis]|uniref:uncharacterized protein n=1 Tax=Bacidia gigantensis TaxID=2732470 RepID=UPI001D03813F|nr:uncharacterized protein KY384_006612 [Bacidia gigantensis]KAG8528923.1 hypothetical protein KY384_006612 [Bacidia gigantensis]
MSQQVLFDISNAPPRAVGQARRHHNGRKRKANVSARRSTKYRSNRIVDRSDLVIHQVNEMSRRDTSVPEGIPSKSTQLKEHTSQMSLPTKELLVNTFSTVSSFDPIFFKFPDRIGGHNPQSSLKSGSTFTFRKWMHDRTTDGSVISNEDYRQQVKATQALKNAKNAPPLTLLQELSRCYVIAMTQVGQTWSGRLQIGQLQGEEYEAIFSTFGLPID